MLKHRPFSLSPVLPWVLLVSLFNPTTFGRPALFSRTGGPKETSREKCHEKMLHTVTHKTQNHYQFLSSSSVIH